MDYFDELYLTERDLGEDVDSELHRESRYVSDTCGHRLGSMSELSDEFWGDQDWDEIY